MPGDINPWIHHIWTHPKNKDGLGEICRWSFGRISRAIDWLDAMDEADERLNPPNDGNRS